MTPQQLRDLRARLSLSQRDLGKLLGRGVRQIVKYEAGQAPIPKEFALACAALSLGLKDYPSP